MKAMLIALDIDGTILDKPSGFSVPAAVREAVKDARKGGARVCLCSSRPCFFMEDAIQGFDEIDALIGSSGAEIEIGGELYYRDSLPLTLLLDSLEIANRNGLYISFGGEEKILVLKRGEDDPGNADPDLESNANFALMNEGELLESFNKAYPSCAFIFLKPELAVENITGAPEFATATLHSTGYNCFIITNKGTDKGTGVLRLADYYGIPHEAILAVGNDNNDIPMLKVAGIGVAVANASQGALDAAGWIAPSVWEAGAAEAIRRYAL